MFLAGTERHNFPRFKGRPPFYEVYYLRFTDVAQQVGVWYRQTLLATTKGKPVAGLWWILFDLADPSKSFAAHQQVPINQVRLEEDIFYFEVEGGKLYQKGTDGNCTLQGETIEWKFHWEPNHKAFCHFPSRLFYRLPFPKTKVLSPNPDLKINGHLNWGSRRFTFDQVPGQQSHLWGKTHAASWVWGHCNAFPNEAASFEGLSARVRVGNRLLPPLTLLRAVVGGEEYLLNRPWQWRRHRSVAQVDRWHFEGENRRSRLVGDVFVEPSQLIGVTYTDPDGSKRYCYHTESARLELTCYRRAKKEWLPERTLRSDPAMAYEFATSEPLADIPLKIA